MKPPLTPSQREEVERAIAGAEARTSAEFVVIIARRSASYQRAEDTFGLFLGLLAIAIPALLGQPAPDSGSWAPSLTTPFGLFTTLLLFAAGSAAGSALAASFPILARPFRTRRETSAAVRRRALDCFNSFRIHQTPTRGGLLIYISLLEHTAFITPDDAIAAKLPADTWQPICRQITQGFRNNNPARGLTAAIHAAADTLAPILPPEPTPQDHLPNTIHYLP